jgi:hypothetical protein
MSSCVGHKPNLLVLTLRRLKARHTLLKRTDVGNASDGSHQFIVSLFRSTIHGVDTPVHDIEAFINESEPLFERV